MKLVKVENKARGELLGFYIVACGECVRVDPWNCYRFSPVKKVDGKEVTLSQNPELFKEEQEKTLKKQKNNWRKLHLLPLVEVETFDELFEVIKQDKKDEEKIKDALNEYNSVMQGGGIDD